MPFVSLQKELGQTQWSTQAAVEDQTFIAACA